MRVAQHDAGAAGRAGAQRAQALHGDTGLPRPLEQRLLVDVVGQQDERVQPRRHAGDLRLRQVLGECGEERRAAAAVLAPRSAQVAVEVAAAALVPFLLTRPLRALPSVLALSVVATLAMGAAADEVRDLARAAGWNGL